MSKDQSIIKAADDDDGIQETVMSSRPSVTTYLSGCCCCYIMFTNMFASSGNDKPVSDVSINVGPPAIEQLDAWTAYKTERGPVFYYNSVTGMSTCEKPVGYEGELSMPVQECCLCLIRRLPKSATTKQVREIFSQFGRILDAMVFMNNFTDVSMGHAYIIFETRTARSAAMGCNGMFLGGNMISVCDAKEGFGVNAYEFEDGLFNDCITIGETRKRRRMEWPDCGGSHVEKATQMLVAGESRNIIQEALL